MRVELVKRLFFFNIFCLCLQINLFAQDVPAPPLMPDLSQTSTVASPVLPPPTLPQTTAFSPPPIQPVAAQPNQTPGAKQQPAPGAQTVEYSEAEIGSQGNWLKKREWLKESQKILDRIQEIVKTIQDSKQTYQDQFSVIDDTLDTFYKQEALKRGKIKTLFLDLEKYLGKKRKKELQLLKEEDMQRGVAGEYEIKLGILEEDIKKQRAELEQLQLDFKSIKDLDKSLSARLTMVDNQINNAVDEYVKAGKLVDKIWYIIDDKKARLIYYDLKGKSLVKLQNIQNYIQRDLLQDFNNVINVINNQINNVKSQIKALEDKGFIIRDRSRRVEELKLKDLEQLQAQKEQDAIDEEEIVKQEPSFLGNIYNYIVDITARFWMRIQEVFGLKTKKKKLPRKTIPTQPDSIKTSQVPSAPTQPGMPVPPPPSVPQPPASSDTAVASPPAPVPSAMPTQDVGMPAPPPPPAPSPVFEAPSAIPAPPMPSGMPVPPPPQLPN